MSPDFILHITGMAFSALAVYIGVRIDLARLHIQVESMRDHIDALDNQVIRAHNRIDALIHRET